MLNKLRGTGVVTRTFPAELDDLKTDLGRFEESLQSFAQRLGLRLTDLEVDHIAVRCHQDTTAIRWGGWSLP